MWELWSWNWSTCWTEPDVKRTSIVDAVCRFFYRVLRSSRAHRRGENLNLCYLVALLSEPHQRFLRAALWYRSKAYGSYLLLPGVTYRPAVPSARRDTWSSRTMAKRYPSVGQPVIPVVRWQRTTASSSSSSVIATASAEQTMRCKSDD